MRYIRIIEPLTRHKNGYFGRYALYCPYCGKELVIHTELHEKNFLYTALTENHHGCHIIDEDYSYFYAKNPFIEQVLLEHYKRTKQ